MCVFRRPPPREAQTHLTSRFLLVTSASRLGRACYRSRQAPRFALRRRVSFSSETWCASPVQFWTFGIFTGNPVSPFDVFGRSVHRYLSPDIDGEFGRRVFSDRNGPSRSCKRLGLWSVVIGIRDCILIRFEWVVRMLIFHIPPVWVPSPYVMRVPHSSEQMLHKGVDDGGFNADRAYHPLTLSTDFSSR